MTGLFDGEGLDPGAGFRLQRLEVYNWGTFHDRVWGLELGGANTLVTGDIGSGKSTLVDAITTLLVPPQRLAYNKAAGADARERTLRSYVLGVYKSERGDAGSAARPVTLRDHNAFSVILARFYNRGFDHRVTLAVVSWFRDTGGSPDRLYVVADRDLSIDSHFSDFGTEMKHLRKRLRAMPEVEVHESFPPYAAAFRRRFGLESDQALELFHQTVSLKSVADLTDFVREHMLEEFPVDPRVDALIGHFDDLKRAHDAVLRAKDQIERLSPLVDDCGRHAELSSEVQALRSCRDVLHSWFAVLKSELLERRISGLEEEIGRRGATVDGLKERQAGHERDREELRSAIAASGGDRIEWLKAEIARTALERDARRKRAEQYDDLARAAGLPGARDEASFAANRRMIAAAREEADAEHAEAQNALTEASVDFRGWKEQHDEIARELKSLRERRTNIPARMLALRNTLARQLGLDEDALPFAGELLQVREEERAWEGAIERLLRNFGLSLLVADEHYGAVAQAVNQTHLGERLVYFRVRTHAGRARRDAGPEALWRKLIVKPDSGLYEWLDGEIQWRFDHASCDTMDQFRREKKAITPRGQIKGNDDRHEKDDRHRIDDRTRYVLGWSNEAKIAALEADAAGLEGTMQRIALRIAAIQGEMADLDRRRAHLGQIAVFETFRDLDWEPLAVDIHARQEELSALEGGSDVLKTLTAQLASLEIEIAAGAARLTEEEKDRAICKDRADTARALLADCQAALAEVDEQARAIHFPRLEAMRADALGSHTLTVESCDGRQRVMREWLQARIDAEDSKVARLRDKIVKAMQEYRHRYPLETQEVDASVEAGREYAVMLEVLRTDDLPRFEARFKELLNENTIREVANFHSQLQRERQTIRERIEAINLSLRSIDYNPGRYIELDPQPSPDADIRDFQQDLRACTEGSLTGSEDEAYSEGKFHQVKRIIERFRGREGSAEVDRRWRRKVTDVRQWFAFSAVERWREDGREHEHYPGSGGKSGGQKEKLAYTVLAASLAYQFGLDPSAARSRTFRFVVIDEAFGRGSDESARYGLELFGKLDLQLLVVTPLQKIHVIEPHVAGVGFVHNHDGRLSMLRNLTIEEYRAEKAARSA